MEIITFSKLGKRPDLLSRMGIERKDLKAWRDFYTDCDYVKTGHQYDKARPMAHHANIAGSRPIYVMTDLAYQELVKDSYTRGQELFFVIGKPCKEDSVYVFCTPPSVLAKKIIKWFHSPEAQMSDDVVTWDHWTRRVEQGVAYRGGMGYGYSLFPYKMVPETHWKYMGTPDSRKRLLEAHRR